MKPLVLRVRVGRGLEGTAKRGLARYLVEDSAELRALRQLLGLVYLGLARQQPLDEPLSAWVAGRVAEFLQLLSADPVIDHSINCGQCRLVVVRSDVPGPHNRLGNDTIVASLDAAVPAQQGLSKAA